MKQAGRGRRLPSRSGGGTQRRPSKLQRRLAAQILEYARRNGVGRGEHLPEELLAQELGVSRSPIRAALTFLEAEGALKRRANRGFFLEGSPEELERVRGGLADGEDEILYLRIARDLFARALPEHVSEAMLLRRYAVTRSGLLRALLRLSEEGIARRGQGHGWTFLPVLNTPEMHDQRCSPSSPTSAPRAPGAG